MKNTPSLLAGLLLPFVGFSCSPVENSSAEFTATQEFLPQPTEHRLDEDYERRNKSARKAWQAAMHRAAPDVDWKKIEHQNGLTAMSRRNNPGGRSALPPGQWRELGSRNQAGRMHSSVLVRDSILYSGSNLGGVWIGNRDGTNWTPLGDNLWGGGKALSVIPGATLSQDVILRSLSGELHRSDDLGVTWTKITNGLTKVGSFGVVKVLDNGEALLVGRDSSVSIGGWGIYVSQDQGLSFSLRANLGTGGSAQLWKHRTQPGVVLMLQSGQLSGSTDYGKTFQSMGVAMPISLTKPKLRACEATNPPTVYVIGQNGNADELWRTTDGGATWELRRTIVNYWGPCEVSMTDPNLVAWGEVDCFVTYDGGLTARRVNSWTEYYGNPAGKLHADIQGLNCYPDPSSSSGEIWYIGTDGGVYESVDQMQSVNNLSLSDLGVSQYYSTLTSLRKPELVVAGSQDQGWQRAELGTPPIGGGSWADFDQLISGDYGHASSSNGTHDLVFSPYPGFVLISEGEDNPNISVGPNFPSGSNPLWLPPVVADPDNPEKFFLSAKDAVWSCDRQGGNNWNWSVHSTTSFGGRTLSALRFSPLNSQLAWAATEDGTLWHSSDHAKTWTQSTSTGPGSHYFYGTAIWPSRLDPNEVWVGGSGYSTSPVWRSLDGGKTFQSESTGLPPTLVYCLCESPDQSGRMFAGSVTNAWTWDPATASWEDLTVPGAPLTTYWSVESVRESNTVRFGTYGRGIWDYELETPGSFPYGNLRGGANTMELDSMETPTVGNLFSLTVNNGPAQKSGWFLVSRSPQEVAMNGGTLLVDMTKLVIQSNIASNAQGTVLFSKPIPPNPSLSGTEWFAQAFLLDPLQPSGWAISNGLRVVIG